MYKKLNVNPKGKKTGDCAFRAVAAATGLGWDKAYEGLCAHGFELKTAPNEPEAIESFLLTQGFKIGKIKVEKGSKRPTVAQFAEQHPNWYSVLRVANHVTCCANGVYVDIWDCGNCSVYKYWYKEIN